MFPNAVFFAHRYGQKLKGVEKAPYVMKDFLNKNIQSHFIHERGNIVDNLKSLYNYNSLLLGKRVNIGGDHSMLISTGAHSLIQNKNTKFVHIDAHADINNYKNSESKNFHGMPYSYLTQMDNPSYFPFMKSVPKLPFENIMFIGLRSVDDFEWEVIHDKNIKHFTAEECLNSSTIIEEIMQFCHNQPVHLSFDVDAVDPEYIPSTGTPVKNGLSKSFVKDIIQHTLGNCDVYNFDICELNLSIGTDEDKKKSLKNTLEICENVFQAK